MQSGLHAIRWSLQRLALVLGIVVFVPVFAYVLWVFAIVAIQGAGGFAQ